MIAARHPNSALTAAQDQRLARCGIDPDHVWWWRPGRHTDGHGVRAWRGISLAALPYFQPPVDYVEDGRWNPSMECEVLYAIGHNLPADRVLEAVEAHALWAHRTPHSLRPLAAGDLVESWAEFLRHRRFGCPDWTCEQEDSLYIFDASPGDYRVTPVTRIAQPEVHAA